MKTKNAKDTCGNKIKICSTESLNNKHTYVNKNRVNRHTYIMTCLLSNLISTVIASHVAFPAVYAHVL